MPSPTPGDSSSRSRSRQAPHCLLVHGLQKSTTRLAANYSFSESQEQARRRYCSNYVVSCSLVQSKSQLTLFQSSSTLHPGFPASGNLSRSGCEKSWRQNTTSPEALVLIGSVPTRSSLCSTD